MSRDETLERAYRQHAVHLLALLARELRSVDLAEEALQDAHEAALRQWREDGVPENPEAWLLTVARRRARDRLRRESTLTRKLPLLITGDEQAPPEEDYDVTTIPDERLRLVFTACHPAFATETQVALTLRFVGGLTTREIARLFLVSERAMAARITRGKRKLARAGVPYRVPSDADLPERLTAVLAVVYLIFTEGYAPTGGRSVIRSDLCEEAIRLGRLLAELLPDEPEVAALLALMLLQHARRDARVVDERLVRLPDQDRRRWHREEIDEGLALAASALRHGTTGVYLLQALIAAQHAAVDGPAETDWNTVATLYERLEQLHASPAVRLNRAVAVAEADGAAAGLRLLADLDGRDLPSHQLPAARAELLARLGRTEAALAAYDDAIERAGNDTVRSHLVSRRADTVGAAVRAARA